MKIFLCLKSYGDFVIQLYAIKNFNGSKNVDGILITKHLKPLSDALSFGIKVLIVGDRKNYPAIFNLKSSNLLKILSDYIYYIFIFSSKCYKNFLIILDSYTIRYSIVLFNNNVQFLPSSKNIYLAYADFLNCKKVQFSTNKKCIRKKNTPTIVGIFVDSRVDIKRIRDSSLSLIVKLLSEYDTVVRVFFYAKSKNQDYRPLMGCSYEWYSSFEKLISNLTAVDIVISSDSVTAHLAELFEKPVYVILPYRNDYWLPLSSYISNSCCTFDDLSNGKNNLVQFLSRLLITIK